MPLCGLGAPGDQGVVAEMEAIHRNQHSKIRAEFVDDLPSDVALAGTRCAGDAEHPPLSGNCHARGPVEKIRHIQRQPWRSFQNRVKVARRGGSAPARVQVSAATMHADCRSSVRAESSKARRQSLARRSRSCRWARAPDMNASPAPTVSTTVTGGAMQ